MNAPILQHLLRAYKIWYEYRDHLTKKSRYTLGNEIDTVFIGVLEFVFLASNSPKEKKSLYLERAVVKFDLLKFLLQMAWEIKTLDNKKYVVLSEQLNDIGKMLGGWYKKITNETSATEGGRKIKR